MVLEKVDTFVLILLVLGGVIILIVHTVVCWCCIRKRKKPPNASQAQRPSQQVQQGNAEELELMVQPGTSVAARPEQVTSRQPRHSANTVERNLTSNIEMRMLPNVSAPSRSHHDRDRARPAAVERISAHDHPFLASLLPPDASHLPTTQTAGRAENNFNFVSSSPLRPAAPTATHIRGEQRVSPRITRPTPSAPPEPTTDNQESETMLSIQANTALYGSATSLPTYDEIENAENLRQSTLPPSYEDVKRKPFKYMPYNNYKQQRP